ncbi:TniQ family protein [Streptomyces sp. NPDC056061]|uniref:TniQ family protein n=1 Tax=Streptomyces sp. NPDC056061 TaxID=3345700 RepID=UPI0035D54049
MNQTVLTDPSGTAPDTTRDGASAVGAWAQFPPPAAGVFRVRPLAFEATASYFQRLAHTYRLTLPQLCDGAGITLHGHGTTPTAGLVLSLAAAHRIAILSRIPIGHLARTLPHLPQDGATPGGAATARWTPFDALYQPVAACTLCTRRYSRGTTGTAWVHRPWHQLVCPWHHQAAPDPRLSTPLRTAAVPALGAAYRAHQRLRCHRLGASAWMTARAITTRCYDHQQHLADRWRQRGSPEMRGKTHNPSQSVTTLRGIRHA